MTSEDKWALLYCTICLLGLVYFFVVRHKDGMIEVQNEAVQRGVATYKIIDGEVYFNWVGE